MMIDADATSLTFKFFAVGNVLVDCYSITKTAAGSLSYSTCLAPPPPMVPVYSLLSGALAGSVGPKAYWRCATQCFGGGLAMAAWAHVHMAEDVCVAGEWGVGLKGHSSAAGRCSRAHTHPLASL